jgi:hypothetical protein
MEDQNIYTIDDDDQGQEMTANESSERGCSNDDSGHVYMVMNAAQVKSSAYETLQVGNTTPTEEIKKKGKDKKTRVWMTIVILLTVLAVFTVLALAVGALGLRETTNTVTVAKETRNYTYLMEEISALKNVLVEMNFETQENISQLNDRFFSSVSTSIDELQSSASQNSNSIRLLKRTTIPQLSSSISDLSISDIYSLSTSIRRLSSTSCACPKG